MCACGSSVTLVHLLDRKHGWKQIQRWQIVEDAAH